MLILNLKKRSSKRQLTLKYSKKEAETVKSILKTNQNLKDWKCIKFFSPKEWILKIKFN